MDDDAGADDGLPVDTTDISDGSDVSDTDTSTTASNSNPSTGLDVNGLLSQLLGSATTSYVASQGQLQPVVAAPASATTILAGLSSADWLIIAGAFVLILALRR
jgi:hypothetical protein